MEMSEWFLKDAAKIQNGRQRSTLFFPLKYGDVQVTFLKVFFNSKLPSWINFSFFVGEKTQNIKGDIFQIIPSHSPRYGDVQVFF